MNKAPPRRKPPYGLAVLACFSLYGVASVALTWVLGLPWQTPLPHSLALTVGDLLLVFGFCMYLWSNRSLGLSRALGKELFASAAESTLVTTGAYSHLRNPIYLSFMLLLLGLFGVTRFTPVAIITLLAFTHFMIVARWEDRELTRRFGAAYQDYKQRVPFLIPSLRGAIVGDRAGPDQPSGLKSGEGNWS
jgi:protein-S-isoprenylcysteine O-methyltransferase Ste14